MDSVTTVPLAGHGAGTVFYHGSPAQTNSGVFVCFRFQALPEARLVNFDQSTSALPLNTEKR